MAIRYHYPAVPTSVQCTALCGLMIRLADESMVWIALNRSFPTSGIFSRPKRKRELAKVLIHNIYQERRIVLSDTLESAQSLAESIGSTFCNANINSLVETYKDLIEGQIGRKLTWEKDDIALQNIQARVRAPGVWLC